MTKEEKKKIVAQALQDIRQHCENMNPQEAIEATRKLIAEVDQKVGGIDSLE